LTIPYVRSAFFQAIGLGPAPLAGAGPVPCYAAGSIIFSFIFSYGVLSSRTLKQAYRIDHNVAPREDLAKYGEAAVQSGKITRKQLDRLRRLEAASANSVEHFPLFVGAVVSTMLSLLHYGVYVLTLISPHSYSPSMHASPP
jgi:hypothetical protein